MGGKVGGNKCEGQQGRWIQRDEDGVNESDSVILALFIGSFNIDPILH